MSLNSIKNFGTRLSLFAAMFCLFIFRPDNSASGDTTEKEEPALFINDGDGLRNGSFEQWVEGNLLFWHVSNENAQFLHRNVQTVRDGRYALQMSGTYIECKTTTLLEMDQPLDRRIAIFKVRARAFEESSTYAFIEYGNAGESVLLSEAHSGDGKWHTLEASATFPSDFHERDLRVGLLHKSDGKTSSWVFFDQADVFIYPAEKDLYRGLISDPELVKWQEGTPINWTVIEGSISRVSESNEEIISMRLDPSGPTSQKGTQLQLPLSLYALDTGKALRISVVGKSDEAMLRYAVYGLVGGRMTAFDHGGRKSAYVTVPATGEWIGSSRDFQIPSGFESGSALLLIQLNSKATKPALLDSVNARVVETR